MCRSTTFPGSRLLASIANVNISSRERQWTESCYASTSGFRILLTNYKISNRCLFLKREKIILSITIVPCCPKWCISFNILHPRKHVMTGSILGETVVIFWAIRNTHLSFLDAEVYTIYTVRSTNSGRSLGLWLSNIKKTTNVTNPMQWTIMIIYSVDNFFFVDATQLLQLLPSMCKDSHEN